MERSSKENKQTLMGIRDIREVNYGRFARCFDSSQGQVKFESRI